jgi:2-hydroxychromene-2-carboxylate isomerase
VLAPGAGEVDRAEVERRAGAQGLPEVRWPPPFDSELAMRATTYAKQGGRAVAFSLAAMRQAFAAGRDMGDPDNVLIAAAACELHPRAVLKAIESRAVEERLAAASVEASRRVSGPLPAIAVAGECFTGPGAVEAAALAAS